MASPNRELADLIIEDWREWGRLPLIYGGDVQGNSNSYLLAARAVAALREAGHLTPAPSARSVAPSATRPENTP